MRLAERRAAHRRISAARAERTRPGRVRSGRVCSGRVGGYPRTDMIKSLSLLTRRPELSHEQFMKHWVEIHAPLAHSVPGIRRYVQNHIKAERTRPDVPALEVAIDGVAELWFDDQAAMDAVMRSPEMKALHADGALFIGRIRSYLVEELAVIG